jgi:ABC-type branched-subunit amino acid transport system permease subunit
MSTLVWLIGGLISGVSAILEAPKASVFVLGGSGASFLVRALGAALIGRMTSLPTTFVAGIGIGVLESITFANYPNGGTVELVVFAVVMGALLWRAAELSRSSRDPASAINFGAEAPPLARRVNAMLSVRRLRAGTLLTSAAVGVALPWLPIFGLNTAAKTFLMSLVLCYAIVGVSLCVLTGWGGQVSLGQFALVGVGAFAASRLTESAHLPFWLVTILAGTIGAAVAVAIGLPAVRIQGLFLAVSTMAFAVLAQGYLFEQPRIVGNPGGVYTPRPSLLQGEKAVYYFGLGALILFLVAARNFRRSGPGRMLLAVRDNDKAARMAGVSAMGSRLVGFALAGFMATIAGVLFAYARQRYVATDFSPDNSFNMLTMVVIGGLGSLPGAVLGAIFEFGIPVLAKGTQASQLFQFLFGGVGGLVFLMFIPRGMAGAVYGIRDAVVSRLVRRADHLPAPPSLIPPWRDLVRVMLGRPVAPVREPA